MREGRGGEGRGGEGRGGEGREDNMECEKKEHDHTFAYLPGVKV